MTLLRLARICTGEDVELWGVEWGRVGQKGAKTILVCEGGGASDSLEQMACRCEIFGVTRSMRDVTR